MLLKSETPDLVLLDLMLPGMDGEALLPLIKSIPVIVVSAKIGGWTARWICSSTARPLLSALLPLPFTALINRCGHILIQP